MLEVRNARPICVILQDLSGSKWTKEVAILNSLNSRRASHCEKVERVLWTILYSPRECVLCVPTLCAHCSLVPVRVSVCDSAEILWGGLCQSNLCIWRQFAGVGTSFRFTILSDAQLETSLLPSVYLAKHKELSVPLGLRWKKRSGVLEELETAVRMLKMVAMVTHSSVVWLVCCCFHL